MKFLKYFSTDTREQAAETMIGKFANSSIYLGPVKSGRRNIGRLLNLRDVTSHHRFCTAFPVTRSLPCQTEDKRKNIIMLACILSSTFFRGKISFVSHFFICKDIKGHFC